MGTYWFENMKLETEQIYGLLTRSSEKNFLKGSEKLDTWKEHIAGIFKLNY